MSLTKALIIADYGNRKEEKIDVLFNPNEYSLDTENDYTWHTSAGLSMPVGQFISGKTPSLTMELFFDTYESQKDVRDYTKKITKLMAIDSDLHTPPMCRFVWGSLDFRGIVQKVGQQFTMFLQSGIPVRATLKVTFQQTKTVKEQYQDIPRQSADRTKQRMVHHGEQLWMIANEEYEDPTLWRSIAKANHIYNPMQLENGKRLIVPRLE
ncbi:CIS tube protein [Bacillus horti]|uniref:Contractile injection system tube protein N-terminal domain-containing protein n=1 Tax=Caldalkalibacillus horti TaxID=77523 RepID=A0ABT9W004_9BACI|nr:LysM peptidoglycan-binding domain-containing protein [Bacillus horti]MDQ0166563.1 hypothetical protein [Bacillus horti]